MQLHERYAKARFVEATISGATFIAPQEIIAGVLRARSANWWARDSRRRYAPLRPGCAHTAYVDRHYYCRQLAPAQVIIPTGNRPATALAAGKVASGFPRRSIPVPSPVTRRKPTANIEPQLRRLLSPQATSRIHRVDQDCRPGSAHIPVKRELLLWR